MLTTQFRQQMMIPNYGVLNQFDRGIPQRSSGKGLLENMLFLNVPKLRHKKIFTFFKELFTFEERMNNLSYS